VDKLGVVALGGGGVVVQRSSVGCGVAQQLRRSSRDAGMRHSLIGCGVAQWGCGVVSWLGAA
jgi:hypothetical protein